MLGIITDKTRNGQNKPIVGQVPKINTTPPGNTRSVALPAGVPTLRTVRRYGGKSQVTIGHTQSYCTTLRYRNSGTGTYHRKHTVPTVL